MLSANGFLNDGSNAQPKLRVYLNMGTLEDLRPDTVWPGLQGVAAGKRLAEDDFEGVQLINDAPPQQGLPFPHCGLNRINSPHEADAIAARHAARGDVCLTVHAGWGMEDDDEAAFLVDAILSASAKHCLPIFLETHRATITQDLWRTVQLTKRFPQIRFNGDFSHYYCGQELVYGDWEEKLQFMAPIFQRTGFLHGRIASPGCIQVPIDDLGTRPTQAHGEINYLDHFKQLWRCAMEGFLHSAGTGDVLIFAPELLSGHHYYARRFPDATGTLVEESDRYDQALRYKQLAHMCFDEALRRKAKD